MSYHDSHMGIQLANDAVVSPLVRIERKFNKIKKLLNNEEGIEQLSGNDLKKLIEEILNE